VVELAGGVYSKYCERQARGGTTGFFAKLGWKLGKKRTGGAYPLTALGILDKGHYQECFCVLDLLWC
jgi:hypothetical protein